MVKRILKAKQTQRISLGIGLVLTVCIVALLVFRTDFFSRHAGRILTSYLFRGTPFSLDIGKLSGNPLGEITVRDLRVRYSGEDYSFDVIRVERIKIAYKPRLLLSGSPRIDELELERPHVWIKPDTAGVNIIPHRAGSGGGGYPGIAVDRLRLSDGQLIYQGKGSADAFRRISAEGSLSSDGGEISARLAGGGAEDLRRGIVLRDMRGELRYRGVAAGDQPAGRISMDGFRVQLDRSVLTLTGTVSPDILSVDLSIGAEPVDVVEVARLLGVETGHTGEVQGVIAVQGVPDSMAVSAVLNGVLSGYALDGFFLEGSYRRGTFTVDHASGGFNGAAVAGSGSYRSGAAPVLTMDVETSGLDLSAGFVDSESIPRTDLSGRVRMTYLLRPREIVFDLDLGPGHVRRFPFDAATVSGSWSPDSLEFSRILLVAPTHTVSSSGAIRGDALRFYLDVVAARSDTIFNYLGIGKYRADLDMNGIIEGTLDDWELRGSGDFGGFSGYGALVPGGGLKLAVRRADGYEAFLELAGDSCVIEPLSFCGVDLSLEYRSGLVSVKRLRLDRSGFAAEMRGEILAGEGRTGISVTDLEVVTLDEVWRSAGDFDITVEDGSIVFKDLQLHSRLGALYLDAAVDRKAGRIEADLSFDRLGLALLNGAGLLERPIGGRGRGTISCAGTIDDPDLTIDLGVGGITWDTLAVDTLFLAARYSGGSVTVDTFSASSPLGGLDASGTFRGGARIRELMRGGEALASLIVDAEASCRNLSLAPFLRYTAKIPFDRGAFTGRIALSDSLAHPVAKMEGSVADLGREGLSIPLFRFRSDLAGQSVRLEGEVELSEKHRGSFTGRVPLRREPWLYSVDDGGRLFLELILPPGELDEIPRVTDLVATARGRYAATVSVEGTVSDPVILGELTLAGAEFRPAGMEERFSAVDATILLQDTLVTVSRLAGREGKDGRFECAGRIVLSGWRPSEYDLDVRLEKFLVASLSDIIAIVSGRLRIGTETVEGEAVPSVEGEVEVNRAEVFYAFEEHGAPGPSGTFAAPSWLARVDVEIPGNAWIRTPDANIELRGDVTLYHDQRGTYLRGHLDLVRGWYNIYANKFRVRSGTIDFVRAEDDRPVVNIEAETLDPEGRKIFLTLVWLQDDIEPRVTLTHEDPGYSETDIWKMLGGGMVRGPGEAGTTFDAVTTAQGLAANYIERVLNSQMEGITIEVEKGTASAAADGTTDYNETMVAVGKYLSEGLYVKYKQGLSISTARHIEVEYRINRWVLLRSELIKYSERVIQGKSTRTSDEFNVDLKLRWEF